MDTQDISQIAAQLAAGFETLQEEYKKLFGQHQSLERKLATARQQYNELAKLCGSGAIATPPLSLSSPPGTDRAQPEIPDVATLISTQQEAGPEVADRVKAAAAAAQRLDRLSASRHRSPGVKIWSGPAADRPELACSTMPSISESPLEQDFTIEGKPSKLGCPFAGMANKKLSSHAASVLSRYNTRDSVAGIPSTPLSSISRVDGRDGWSRRGSRRASVVDPIKAEICGISDHNEADQHTTDLDYTPQVVPVENAEAGVCPIRFLDQHSPEEVATYFENHKHELPRSHEVCVRRYQSNEAQIRQLDAKYGNLVSMIQGLGAKHKELLPDEPVDGDSDLAAQAEQDKKSDEKVRKWASSVSAPMVESHEALQPESKTQDDERQPHFERPLRDIRVGESPSRPWGISVPAKYLEEHHGSDTSSRPVQGAASTSEPQKEAQHAIDATALPEARVSKCPFGFDQSTAAAPPQTSDEIKSTHDQKQEVPQPQQPVFVAPEVLQDSKRGDTNKDQEPRMLFTGPVFIGYSAEDAAKILRGAGLGG
ncbi:hypothetical protein LTR62_003190 [Meristemomyces frigidus]|uniref:Uncharacterized protein n=1 Tax=Meristemomyces frigidus TaxID=1508187 RepID=A0AAN7YH51_9PEZI|nr:hypothetical protein LTR62_003190 [Meristemomyces frigidus]